MAGELAVAGDLRADLIAGRGVETGEGQEKIETGRQGMNTQRNRPRGQAKKNGWLPLSRAGLIGMCAGLMPLALGSAADAATLWNLGDVYAGIANGQYGVFTNAGVPKETISDGLSGYTTGCGFNPDLTKLYATNFDNQTVTVFNNADPHAILQTINTGTVGTGDSFATESIVFRGNGNFLVGHADGAADIYEFDATGAFVAQYDVATERRGSDWIDLANDQRTLFYTSEGRIVFRYDTATRTQLANFAVLPGVGIAFALRLLPPGDGTGGLLVADKGDVKRLDGAGAHVQTYDVPTETGTWFSLNLDPNGTSFWAGAALTNNFYRFNIASGAVEIGPINTGGNLNGLCVKGELTAGTPTRRLDHFLAYKTKDVESDDEKDDDIEEDAKGKVVVQLHDQFDAHNQTRRYVLKDPIQLANPVEKKHGTKTTKIANDDDHLVAYKIRRVKGELKNAHWTKVTVDNQFGRLSLDTNQPDRLMVPSAKSLTGPVELPAEFKTDHFKCYRAGVTKGSPSPPAATVSLLDQFNQPRDYDLLKVVRLCNPVDKNGAGIDNATSHLVCYDIKRAKRQAKTRRVSPVYTNNQFGRLVLTAREAVELCVPSTKDMDAAKVITEPVKPAKKEKSGSGKLLKFWNR